MPILGIDTATLGGSIALVDDGRSLAHRRLTERGSHARDLLKAIDDLLRDAQLQPESLRGIAVSIGPGSFTGIRIGMATAKGLAYTLGIGLAGLSTLEAVARATLEAVGDVSGPICPAIRAGRGEVYAALFLAEGGGVRRWEPDRCWEPDALASSLPEATRLAGDGSATVLASAERAGRALSAIGGDLLLGVTIARWGALELPPASPYRLGALGPNYVRPSDAEASRRKD